LPIQDAFTTNNDNKEINMLSSRLLLSRHNKNKHNINDNNKNECENLLENIKKKNNVYLIRVMNDRTLIPELQYDVSKVRKGLNNEEIACYFSKFPKPKVR